MIKSVGRRVVLAGSGVECCVWGGELGWWNGRILGFRGAEGGRTGEGDGRGVKWGDWGGGGVGGCGRGCPVGKAEFGVRVWTAPD